MTTATRPNYSASADLYAALDRAFNHFNDELFDAKVPAVVFTFQRHKRARGQYIHQIWSSETGETRDEINLNPDLLAERDLKETLSTLVHEMCHGEQFHHGKPSRNGYHNKEWAMMMHRVGLIPSDTAAPGGKETGQNCSHYIDAGGAFDLSCERLLKSGFELPWMAADIRRPAKPSKSSKQKYTCGGCGANAWAKPESNLMCGDCVLPMDAD